MGKYRMRRSLPSLGCLMALLHAVDSLRRSLLTRSPRGDCPVPWGHFPLVGGAPLP